MQRLVLATLFLFFIGLGLLWRSTESKDSVEIQATKTVTTKSPTPKIPFSKVYNAQVPEVKETSSLDSLRTNPNDFAALESLLEAFDLEKNPDRRMKIETDLRQISERCKNCTNLKLFAGETALKNSHFESARALFKEVLNEDSSNQAAKRKLIEVSVKLSDYEEASATLESIIEERTAEIARLTALGESTKLNEKFLAEDKKEFLQLQQELN